MSDTPTMSGADDISDGASGTPTVSPWRIVSGIVVTLCALALVVILIGRAAGFADLERVLREGDWRWLAVCATGQIVVFSGYAGVFRTSLAFEGGPHVPTGLSVRVVLTSFALSQLVAAGGAAGLAVNYWALRRLGLARRDALVRLLGLNTVVYLVFGVIGVISVGAALAALATGAAPLGATLPWIVIVPSLGAAAWWFTEPVRVVVWSTPVGGPIRRGLSMGVSAAWWARRVTGDRAGRPTLMWAALYWIGDIASLWGALQAFGEAPALAALALAYVIGYLAAAVPIPLIATGGMDAALTFALQMVGVPLELALVSVVAHRVFAFWIPLVPGLVLGVLLRRTATLLDGARAAGPAAATPAS